MFARVALVGIGLIGSSLARALKAKGLAGAIVAADQNADNRRAALALGLVDEVFSDAKKAVRDADLVILATPVSTFGRLAKAIGPHLKQGAILTDVGSVKQAVIAAVAPYVPDGVFFIPGHPIAGTENSGPEAGYAELFEGRWCLLTPPPKTNAKALGQVKKMWEAMGSKLAVMAPSHHDRVLAITSHLPHLIAYTIVGTADDLSADMRSEVIRYSAGGFHDFTRVAASDPVMWRDIFLNNRPAVLEIIQRFTEDLIALQRAIRWGEGDKLQSLFTPRAPSAAASCRLSRPSRLPKRPRKKQRVKVPRKAKPTRFSTARGQGLLAVRFSARAERAQPRSQRRRSLPASWSWECWRFERPP